LFTNLAQVAIAGGPHELLRSMIYTPLEAFDHLIHDNSKKKKNKLENSNSHLYSVRSINIPLNTIAGVDIASANMNRGRVNGLPGWDEVYSAWNGLFPGFRNIYGSDGCNSSKSSPTPDNLACFTNWMDNATLANMTREVRSI